MEISTLDSCRTWETSRLEVRGKPESSAADPTCRVLSGAEHRLYQGADGQDEPRGTHGSNRVSVTDISVGLWMSGLKCNKTG